MLLAIAPAAACEEIAAVDKSVLPDADADAGADGGDGSDDGG